MYVIKMKTLICYFAVFVLTAASVGIIRLYGGEPTAPTAQTEQSAQTAAETADADGGVPSADAAETVDVPILMYHNIFRSGKSGKYIVSEEGFENDLKFLRDNGYTTVVMQDLIDFVYDGKALPEKSVVLSFDDGYFNNYAYAYPLLKKYNARAVLSIIGYYTDLYTESPDENPRYSHVTWDNVNEMMKSGAVELQNHSYNLHSTDKGRNGSKKKRGESTEQYRQMLTADLGLLQTEFREHTGYEPTTYTYPFGSVSNDSFDIVKELGFRASLSCESGMNHLSRGNGECLYMMKRYLRTPSKSAADILNKEL